jgi:hypothetical protein
MFLSLPFLLECARENTLHNVTFQENRDDHRRDYVQQGEDREVPETDLQRNYQPLSSINPRPPGYSEPQVKGHLQHKR